MSSFAQITSAIHSRMKLDIYPDLL